MGPAQCLPGNAPLRGPDFLRVMFHPARVRKDLPEFPLGHGYDAAPVIKHDGAGTGGALIECQDVFHSRSLSPPRAQCNPMNPAKRLERSAFITAVFSRFRPA